MALHYTRMNNRFGSGPFRVHCEKGKTLVILAPHPDDEILGCGRLIADAAAAGVKAAVVVLTDGQASHPGSRRWPARRLGRLRRTETRRALARLGAGQLPLRFCGWDDGALADTADALRLRAMLYALRAGIVLAASPDDHHLDHKAGWKLAQQATRGTAMPLMPYRVWSRLGAARSGKARGATKAWSMRAFRSQIGPYVSDDPGGFTFAPETLQRLLAAPESVRIVGTTLVGHRGPVAKARAA